MMFVMNTCLMFFYLDSHTNEREVTHLPVEGEPDFYETNCHWRDCRMEFDSQKQLVDVSVLEVFDEFR